MSDHPFTTPHTRQQTPAFPRVSKSLVERDQWSRYGPIGLGTESGPSTEWRRLLATPWLTIDDGKEGSVLVTVAGGIAGDRSIDLWSSLEEALERANGGMVVADLTRVTNYDVDTIDELNSAATASVRRHLDICALMRPNSSIKHYARRCGLTTVLPIYASAAEALASTERAVVRNSPLSDQLNGRHKS